MPNSPITEQRARLQKLIEETLQLMREADEKLADFKLQTDRNDASQRLLRRHRRDK